ncbi:hypothetical protein PybrP1_012402 [[Pythium] brassicae (nom. inval.)]|nr:hypothetical protein PybrP1_012402 [[Pythium] brassicae (nom. inval.)]
MTPCCPANRWHTHILTNHTLVNHSNLTPPLTFLLASTTTPVLTMEIGVQDDGNNSDIEAASAAEARYDEDASIPTLRPNVPIAAPPRDCVVHEQRSESTTHVDTQHGTRLFDEVEGSEVESDGNDESRDNDDIETERGVANTTTRQRSPRRRAYTNKFKLLVLSQLTPTTSITALAAKHSIKCPSSIHAWKARKGVIRAACAAKKSSKSAVGGQGRNVIFANEEEVVQWVKDMRRDDFSLKTSHVVQHIQEEYREWVTSYYETRKSESLHRLVRRLIARFGFSFRRPTQSVLSYEQLISEQEAFVSTVGAAVAATHSGPGIFNADETGVYYGDSPTHIIAKRGSRKSSKVKGKKQSWRASALLVVSAAGDKLPPLIVFQATPGGSVEKGFSALPDGVRYAVQTNGWMDGDIWQRHFIDGLWSDYVNSEFREPMAFYVDNFKSHTASASVEALVDLGAELVPLPVNTTSVLQPLDVGIMGPFKQRLRATSLPTELSFLRERSHHPLRDRLLALARAPADAKRRATAERVILAWQSVSADCITPAWSKSGLFKHE